MIQPVPKPSIGRIPKFHGEYRELKELMQMLDLQGTWAEEPHGVVRFCCPDGSSMHWSTTKGTVWVDGPSAPMMNLREQVGNILELYAAAAPPAEVVKPTVKLAKSVLPPARVTRRKRSRQ